MNGLDFIFLGFICLGGLIGGKLGLFRSLRSLFGFIFAALLSRWTAPYAVTFLSNSSLDNKISSWIESKTGINQWQAQYQVWMDDPQVKAALAQQGFGGMTDILGQQTSIADMGARMILLLSCSIFLFLIFKMLFHRILKLAENYSNKRPLQKKINRIGGMVSGSLTATLLATIGMAIWIPLSTSQNLTNKQFVGTDNSFIAQKWIPAVGLDQYLPLDAATKWLAPMMAKSNLSAERVNADELDNETNHNNEYPAQNKITTLGEWFGTVPITYEEKELSAKVDCKSGSCPEWKIDSETQVIDCWFCDSEWVGIQGDRFIISSEGSFNSDTLAGCTKRTQGPILDGMEITQLTDNLLVVQGPQLFNKSQSGKCEVEYESTVQVWTEWRFYKGK